MCVVEGGAVGVLVVVVGGGECRAAIGQRAPLAECGAPLIPG